MSSNFGSGFSFGASNPQTTQTGSLFGANPSTTTAQATTGGGFSFGSTGFGGTAPLILGGGGSTGFNFPRANAPSSAATPVATTALAGGGFSLGSTSLNTAKPAGLNFGGGSLGGFVLPTQAAASNPAAAATATTAAVPGSTFSLGGTPALSGGFLGSAPATTAQPFSFGGLGGAPTTTLDGGLKLGGLAAPAASANALSTAQPSLGGFKLGTGVAATTLPAATTTPATSLLGGLLSGNKPATTATGQLGGGFGLSTSVATSSATSTSAGFALGGLSSLPAAAAVTASPAAPSGGFGLPSSSLTATASTSAATTSGFTLTFSGNSVSLPVPTSAAPAAAATTVGGAVPPSMNYRQLEEAINKWTTELEEQEAVFLEQATQVNAWDRMLIENGDMITQQNQDVERVVADHQRLDQELDFILGQQGELEDMLKPLEQALDQLPPITYQQHADLEREHTYKLAENVDSQLKRMASDLKEIVEHLNSGTSTQDNNDPLFQIAKILNAHVDSLQWIDQKTGILQRRVEDVARNAGAQHKQQTYR